MNRLAITALLLATTAIAANAADVAPLVKAPVAAPVPYTWTGIYVGVNAGLGSEDGSITSDPIATPIKGLTVSSPDIGLNSFGALGGLQLGYNYQIGTSWVLGVEGDVDWSGIRGSQSSNWSALYAPVPISAAINANASENLNWLSTIRGRFGYLATPGLLVYGTGGLAIGGVEASYGDSITANAPGFALCLACGSASVSETKIGWAAGAGFEYQIIGAWSAKGEYLHYSLGSDTISYATTNTLNGKSIGGTPLNVSANAKFDGDLVRFGLNYKLFQ